MTRYLRLAPALVVVSVALGCAGVPSAQSGAAAPIRAHQHFIGLVNHSHTSPAVDVACPGPIVPGRTGPLTGKQTVTVTHVARGGGNTGLFSGVYMWFAPTKAGPAPVQVRITTYATPHAIPSEVRVPCSGTGTAVFSSCPYLAPCAYGWVPYDVTVRFENIAA